MRCTRTSVFTILEHSIGLARELVRDDPVIDDELLVADISSLFDAVDIRLLRYHRPVLLTMHRDG